MSPNPNRDSKHPQAEQREQPFDAAVTLDPDFDELDGADAEFSAWRWPEREDG